MNRGKVLAIGMVLIGLCLAGFAVVFHFGQEAHLREQWGSETLQRIRHANAVTLVRLSKPANAPKEKLAVQVLDDKLEMGQTRMITDVRGLVHVQHLLVKDHSYIWERELPEADPDWQYALTFTDSKGDEATLFFAPNCRYVYYDGSEKPVEMKVVIDRLAEFCEEALK